MIGVDLFDERAQLAERCLGMAILFELRGEPEVAEHYAERANVIDAELRRAAGLPGLS